MAEPLQILIADEDPGFITLSKLLCRNIPGVNIMGVARSKAMLTAKIKNSPPDLLLVDLTGSMGGLSMVDIIKTLQPQIHIIVMYKTDHHDSDMLVEALEKGVYECLEKPEDEKSRKYKELRLHLLTVTGLLTSRKRFSDTPRPKYKNKFFMPPVKKPSQRMNRPLTGKADIIVIASSTGGPEILSQIFSILPGNLNVPILLVQHIPEAMTQYFARSLDEKSELTICQAENNSIINPSHVYIAPGGRHMKVSQPDQHGNRMIRLSSGPPVNSVRPSADVLFESVAASYDGNVLAVILTGMGEDGRKGVASLKARGCICITQSQETCVVYGMPRAVEENGLSDESLDPLDITQKIVTLVSQEHQ
jgi:two-component system chemotaxis response regulator CheB